ncbi:hypothetical protein [Beggiatoa leptomitoformis]|uniref:Uncharacterized protein n=1 Tax=Beggiatoa leptomitoformis TaxID=288004 RepID=A0A2N9YGY3_9GAMM|nr:hypothetical protein [Beggiatoa leptomitoformis]ALG68064.1 hypothetical protein AL038_10545 [Beggiatoa leptomitoformis]AUI69645.1 hypothetical protein BLE401_13730 [Beggiatoa leptomitoformis]
MQFQASLFDTPAPTETTETTETSNPKTSGVLILEWDTLCYETRYCLGDMAGNLNEKYITDVLAKQNADEVYDFVKLMLQDGLKRMSKNKVTLSFGAKDNTETLIN